MPMRRLLKETVFDQKAITILSDVFDQVVVELDLRDAAEREKAAKILVRLAQGQTTLVAANLAERAIRLMRQDVSSHVL